MQKVKKGINSVTILYDEQGTPTFIDKRETNFFVGVAVAINSSFEKSLFEQCNESFGLSKSKPMKNDKISNSRIIAIGEQLAQLNLLINFFYLNLSDETLYNTVRLYEEFSNLLRIKHRGVKARPIAQILYGQVLSHTLFMTISDYIKLYKISTGFSIFIDNWSFPNCDIDLILNMTSQSLALKNNEITQEFFPGVRVLCDSLQLLDNDSKKKKFIDVLASVISRGFLDKNNPKYSDLILKTIFPDANFSVSDPDITKITIDSLTKTMDDVSRNG
jgi:hypothetical protein